MKRKIAVSLLMLIIAIMCCACAVEPPTEQTYSHFDKDFEDYDDYDDFEEYEFDITYKKDRDDLSPTVYITKYGERYHTPTCHYTKKAYMKLTVRQAIDKGYTACYFCCY